MNGIQLYNIVFHVYSLFKKADRTGVIPTILSYSADAVKNYNAGAVKNV
jgi:hypothetical protein